MNEKNLPTNKELELINAFVSNKELYNAIKKQIIRGLHSTFDIETPTQGHWIYAIDRTLPDDKFAAQVKLIAQSEQIIDSAFEGLQDIQTYVESLKKQKEEKVDEYH